MHSPAPLHFFFAVARAGLAGASSRLASLVLAEIFSVHHGASIQHAKAATVRDNAPWKKTAEAGGPMARPQAVAHREERRREC